jgi:nucleotide-binding universal stress UspA family protein
MGATELDPAISGEEGVGEGESDVRQATVGGGRFAWCRASTWQARSVAERAAKQLDDAGIKAHHEVQSTLYGQVAREIVDVARAHDADVIVMGSRGRGDLASLLLGGTAHKLIQLSDRPVLVIR